MGVAYGEGDVDANGAEEVNLRTSAGAELLGQQTSAASLPVVISRDPLFSVVGQRTAIGTSELNVLLFRNPNASGKVVTLKKMAYNNSATVSGYVRFRLYVSPTVTADGTGATEVSLDIGGSNTPLAVAFTSPTTSAVGSLVFDGLTYGGATAQGAEITFPSGFLIRANNTILVTATADGTNRVANVTLFWEEI